LHSIDYEVSRFLVCDNIQAES